MDFRGLGEQLRRLRHELRRDLALQVGLPAAFVGESVKDAKRVRPHPDRKPGRGARFVIHHRASIGQESCDLLFLAGLGFELDVKRVILLSSRPPTVVRLKQNFAETMA
jgi:hypothetical protein